MQAQVEPRGCSARGRALSLESCWGSPLGGPAVLGGALPGWEQGGAHAGLGSPGTQPARFSYLGLRLDTDGPGRAPGR